MNAATDLQAIEHLDFTPDHKCEAPVGCDSTAVWLTVHGCCGYTAEFCPDHGAEFISIINRCIKNRKNVVCHRCKTYGNAPALYRLVPLPAA